MSTGSLVEEQPNDGGGEYLQSRDPSKFAIGTFQGDLSPLSTHQNMGAISTELWQLASTGMLSLRIFQESLDSEMAYTFL